MGPFYFLMTTVMFLSLPDSAKLVFSGLYARLWQLTGPNLPATVLLSPLASAWPGFFDTLCFYLWFSAFVYLLSLLVEPFLTAFAFFPVRRWLFPRVPAMRKNLILDLQGSIRLSVLSGLTHDDVLAALAGAVEKGVQQEKKKQEFKAWLSNSFKNGSDTHRPKT